MERRFSCKISGQDFLKMVRGEEDAEPHMERSLDAMKLMDEMRRQCGIIFPADEK